MTMLQARPSQAEMTYCPQCRKERQEKVPPEALTCYCAFHAAELALQGGVAEYEDNQGKTWTLLGGVRSKAPGFFACDIANDVLWLHYSDIKTRK